jgi:hypothetical protein
MRPRIGGRFALLAITSLFVGQLATAVPSYALNPPTLYAAVNGGGTACTQQAPCTVPYLFANAPINSTVLIEPGTYPSTTTSYTTGLVDVNGPLTISGIPGRAAPVIRSNSSAAPIELLHHSSLSHISVLFSGSGKGLLALEGSSADHVIVVTTVEGDGACVVEGATLTNSLCLNTATFGAGVAAQPANEGGSTIRNVTAIAPGSLGDGIRVDENGGGHTAATVTNSLFVGGHTDVESSAQGGGSAAVTLSYSEYVSNIQGAGGSISAPVGHVAKAPKFVDAAHYNFREAGGSSSIDAAASTPAHETDLAGFPRRLGKAPDIGAYEYAQHPAAKLHIVKRGRHALTARVSVAPHGLSTLVQVLGSHHKHSKAVTVGSTPQTVTLVVHKLKRHTSYRLHAAVSSLGGHAQSAAKKATTK